MNEPNLAGCTPLVWAADNDRLDVIRLWIASGRELDLGKPGMTKVVTLLERFKRDPGKTRSEVRMELGITGQSPAPRH